VNIAWVGLDVGRQNHPVGGKAANALGLHDMSGNVNEWVNDLYSATYYASSPSTNPPGPASGTSRVLRGGAWSDWPFNLRSSNRYFASPSRAGSGGGFRVARAAGIATPAITTIVRNQGSSVGGTVITITGTNLTDTTVVTVDGVAASSVTVVNATTVTAVTPAGTVGAKPVAVTTPGGTASLANAFTYVPFVTPPWAELLEAGPDPTVVTDARLRNAIVETNLAWRIRDKATQIEMVLVPKGTFNMGCSASNQNGCLSEENPVHVVTLTSAFYLGRYEVMQFEWIRVMGSNPSFFWNQSEQVTFLAPLARPVEQVSWNAIQGFLSATGLRLPTEAEWEYAYRAGTTTAYHSMPGFLNGTNDATQVGNIAWFSSNAASQTRPAGQKAANALGLHDMSGNVWEWVNDLYSATYYASSPSTNPPGPASGTLRVLRGGSWINSSNGLRSSLRNASTPASQHDDVGFRVARTP
jgi:formylglycine-generating enzyme required for sulfatase activity